MSTEAIPGSGHDGQEPSGPALADGFFGEDEDAWLRRVMAETDADEEWLPEEQVQAALSGLAGPVRPAGGDLGGLAEGGVTDAMAPGPELAAVAAGACDPAMLTTLSDNQVLGLAGAGRRLAGRAAWIQQAAIAEFSARRLEPDHKKATPLGFTPFAPDELVPELVVPTGAAELKMAQARDASRRLPANFALLRDGLISEFQLKIITEAIGPLSDEDAAEADKLLAAAAPNLTPGQLRAMCTKTVLMIDPEAAQRRKKTAARDARVTRFQEYSGNGALCGRELPPKETLASSQHIDACARALRAAGIPGTLQQLRVRAYLDLTQGLDPLGRLAGAGTGTADQAGQGHRAGDDGAPDHGKTPPGNADQQDNDTHGNGGNDGTGNDGWDDPADDDEDSDDDGTEGGGGNGSRPGSPITPGGASARTRPPVKAVINLLVPAGTLLGWSTAPGEIAGFGALDPQTTREMTEAAAAHPETRWCVTVVGPDGTASAHGCAPGRHPWTPRDGPGPPPDPAAAPRPPGGPPTAEQATQVADLLRRLGVTLAPIAKGECDHRHHSDRYVISRKLKHLIKARASKCTAPCCNRPAADADADHTIPWPEGPSCECNLGAPCRYHHRNKQAPGWHLEQPEPGVMKWHTPSGRTHTTYPTRYMI
jgi:Domain of unknown function (DUF222)